MERKNWNKNKLHIVILFFFGILNSCSEKHYPVFEKNDTIECVNFKNTVGYVNDFENIFTKKESDTLFEIILNHEKKTTNQIVIVSTSNIASYKNINDYSLDLANCWGVGVKGKNNGIAIVLSKKLRAMRIQVGDGLLDKLTNQETKKIIDEIIIPDFKEGNYYKGIKNGLEAIISEIE